MLCEIVYINKIEATPIFFFLSGFKFGIFNRKCPSLVSDAEQCIQASELLQETDKNSIADYWKNKTILIDHIHHGVMHEILEVLTVAVVSLTEKSGKAWRVHCKSRSTLSASAGLSACSRKACSTTSSTSCCRPLTVCMLFSPDRIRIRSTNSSPVTSSST